MCPSEKNELSQIHSLLWDTHEDYLNFVSRFFWRILFMETTGRTISTTKCVPIPSHDTERPWHQGTTGGFTKPSRRGVGLKRKMRSSWNFQVEDLLRNQIFLKDHLNYHFKGWIIWISSSMRMTDGWKKTFRSGKQLSWILFCWDLWTNLNPEFPRLHRPPHLPWHQPHLDGHLEASKFDVGFLLVPGWPGWKQPEAN